MTRALVARKRKIFALFFALAASVGMSWAAGIPCTVADIGKVLCTDGSMYATVNDATAANKTAVAMIAYIDAGNNKGLALALVEEKGIANWSEAIDKCAAKTPTITGGTWKLASEDEWNKMINAAGGRNALRDGFSAIGGSNLKSDGNDHYWSSTESSNTEKGRRISFNDTFGGWSDGTKTTNFQSYARACLAFNIGEPDPTVTVGALEHGSVVASPTTAEAGTTITLTATPEAGYKLNTIEATYFGAANETLSVENKKNVGRGITAEYNKSNYLYVSSYDGAYNLTVSTNDGTNLIRKIEIEFYGPGVNDARTNSMLSSDHGSWAFEDGDPCTKATINNINAVSVVLSGSGVGMNKAWFPKTMKVYYDGDVLIDLTDTENANVKTFTMVNKAVDVFAEFIPTGSCGENLTWEYSPSTGALVISGTGAMSDYDNNMNKAPWYAYRESISSITLPDGLTYIGKHAFRECNNFTQLVVPNSVTEIGNTAFQDCSKLWNLALPNTLEKIGGAAFERTKISNFTIPEGVTSLDGYVFGECTSLYRVNIHAGVTSLTGNVFYNCTNLNTIYSYVKNPVAITGAVFEGVNKANCKLYVPFTSMAAYQAADEWKDFFIKPIPGTAPTLYLDIDGASATLIYGYPEDGKPAYDEEYGRWDNLDYSYRNDNLKTLTIDASCRENVMTSFKNLFQYFQSLETIRNMAYLSTVNVTNMQSMFDYCKNLTELDLHTFNTAKVTNMETMFSDCSQLVTLDISSFNTSNVTSMYYMFTYDDKLAHIYVGDGWNTDNVTKHERMFQYCGELPNYNYNYLDKTKAHTGDGGYLTALTQIGAWESGDCDVILYSNGRMSVKKKAGNGNGAMANYANKDAQPWADSRNLVTKLDIEDGVKEIGTCAFYDFREMTQLNIHEGVTAIHENAFRNGQKLTILILPSTLRVLGDKADAFTSCPITDIYLTAHPARLTWNEDNDDFIYAFSNPDVHKTTVCHVPANLADAYVAKFITGVEEDKQPNVTFEGGMPAVDMITPEDVIALINEIGEVAYTAECKAKIDAAREAYNGLVDEDKAQVTNITTLTGAENTYNNLKAAAEQAAADVEALINAIGTAEYTAASKAKIDAAREAYDALDDNVKLLVSNYGTLTAAETTYANLKDVVVVEAKINEIPSPMTAENTKLSEYQKVQDARAAYDALTAEQKALVSNLDKLEAAEAAFAAIGGGGGSAPDGALNGKFTIDESSVVYFSKGNLQATTADLGANWTWGFAANQWDLIGDAAANNAISGNGTVSANGTVDLFGWSTSATKYGIHNGTNGNISDYAGDFVDWGTTMGEGWFTLSKEQWEYLLNTRTGDKAATVNSAADCRYTKATINTDGTVVMGIILFPDGGTFAESEFTAVGSPNTANVDFTTTCTTAQWTALQAKGCVFLPAAGRRYGASVSNEDPRGYYWSSSPKPSTDDAYFVFFYPYNVVPASNDFRCLGLSVRLVTEAPASPLAAAQAALDKINDIPQPVVYTPECKEAIKAAREAMDALSDEAKALFATADTAALPAAEAAYAGLLAEKVAPVITAINAVPATPLTPENTKLSEYNKVKAAREVYDALSDEEKNAVDNYDKLKAAEDAFAAIPSVGSETVITWDKNTGIEEIGTHTTTPAYEGITLSTKGGMFGPNGDMLRFYISISDICFEFANTLGANFSKIVLSSTSAIPSTRLNDMGEGWVASNDNKIATWTGDAATVKIWNGITATSYWDVNTIQFTLGATVSATEAAQAAVDLINAIPDPVELSDECKAKIDAAREAVTALGENASLIDDADITKLTTAEAAFALLIKDATEVVGMINAIGEVNFSPECKAKIVAAREAYDALSNELKSYVSNLGTLTAAEAAYETARPFATVTTVPAAVEALQYTGAAQTLITAGAAEHGTILYSLDGENYSTELPTALFAGAYTIYYKVQATDDYKDVAPATFIATIAYNYPATYSLFGIPEGWSVKVNDEEVAVVNGAVKNIAANDRFDIMPVKPEDVKLVEVVPYLLDLATVTDSVIYLMNGDSITGTANGHITVVIVPDAKVYFKDVHLTNTGSHPAVLCGGNAEMVVVGENTISCTKEGESGIRTAGAGTTLTISGDKTLLNATIDDSNGGTVNQ